MDFSKFLAYLKLPTKVYVATSLIAGILLFMPTSWYKFIDIEDIIINYRSIISLVFIVSLVFMLINLIEIPIKQLRAKNNTKKRKKFIIKKLHQLTQREKEILVACLQNDKLVDLDISSGEGATLKNYKIIYRASNVSVDYTSFSFTYSLQDWVYQYLLKNQHLLL